VSRGAHGARDADVLMICVNSADAVDAVVRGLGAGLPRGSAVVGDDPDGQHIQQAVEALFRRVVDAGFGERLAREMPDPGVTARTAQRD
jgi:3-hydroxyisobutyrate dehydrogenase-like beta-hydroxyacid dehydrogenase